MYIFNAIWNSDQAGPSRDNNKRSEIFMMGCKKARDGKPCEGCFNSVTWNYYDEAHYDNDYVVENIIKNSKTKNVTFVGGEPLDQIEDLIYVTGKLKEKGFHIIVFTWRKLQKILNNDYGNFSINKENMIKLIGNIDILIDGEYKSKEHIFNINKKNGFNNAIGSGNQIIWDLKNMIGIPARELTGLKVNNNNDLVYLSNKETKDIKFIKIF